MEILSAFISRLMRKFNYLKLKLQELFKTHLPLGYPETAMIEVCSVCNLRCFLCPAGNSSLGRKPGFMAERTFKKIVDELDDRYIDLFMPVMWGESFLHPKIMDFLRYARNKNWYIDISTNGNISADDKFYDELVGIGIDGIVCAVDGYDQSTYSIYRRGGDLGKVYAFLEGIKKAKDKLKLTRPKVVAQIHLFNFNEDHVADIKRNLVVLVDEVKTKKTRVFYNDSKVDNQAIASMYNSVRPKIKMNQFEPPAQTGTKICTSMLYGVYIAWNGDVIACCGDPSNKLKFGNINEQSLRQIRNSKRFLNLEKDFQRPDL